MQAYVVVMIVLVAGGTLFDIIHKRSAAYFFANWRDSKSKARQQVGGGEMVSMAVQTAVVDVLASGEFCNTQRRIAHLLGMYGFVIYVVATVDHGVRLSDACDTDARCTGDCCGASAR